MRFAARSTQAIIDQRREQSRRKRAAASAIGEAFPAVETIRIELSFRDLTRQEPAGQSHVMYPSAHAYFEFACPYGDCDGSLDLNSVVTSLMTHSTLQVQGMIRCPGLRTGKGMTKQPCGVHAHYRIAVQYGARPASAASAA